MEINDVNKYVKKARKRRILVIIYSVILLFFVMYFVTSSLLMFILMLMLLFQLFVGFVWAQNFGSILADECNPQLYFAVITRLSKNVSPINQALVAEFIGDYSSAFAIYENIYQIQKNKKAKLVCLDGMIRTLFMAESYDQCLQKIEEFKLFDNEKFRDKYKSKTIRHDFYVAYIKGNYQLASECLNAFETEEKKKSNSFYCAVSYYRALIEYKIGNLENAKLMFATIIQKYPHMAHSVRSKEYLNLIENGTPLSVIQVQRVELPPLAQPKKLTKRDILKLVLLLLFILGCAIGVVAMNSATKQETPKAAIESYESSTIASVCTILQPDEGHIVCAYKDELDEICLAYLNIKDNKYICEMTAHGVSYDEDFSKMHIKGKCSEIRYKFQKNNKNIPKGYKCDYVDNNLYIIYKFGTQKQYYGNLYALDLQK